MKVRMSMETLQQTKKQRDSAALITKIGLAAFFLIGVILIWMGIRAQKEFESSGFSSESAYKAIYALGHDVSDAWRNVLRSELDKVSEADRSVLNHTVKELVAEAWQKQDKNAELPEAAGNSEGAFKLLYTVYLINGPKIGAGDRKTITAVSENKISDFRQQLLACVVDESAVLPAEAEKIAEALSGNERSSMLMQAFFISSGSAESRITENVNTFKKTVRDKESQLTAFQMIADNDISWLWQLFISSSKTVILIGIMLILDIILLALLMNAEHLWELDFKWILILLIVDFLLFFQLMPVIYMIIKALFPNGSFSLETLQRLYTYPMNLTALRNTFVAAIATMIFGTLIAFPLAWLVGRTNLYGRKFFRALFVVTYMVPPYVGAMAWLRLMNPNVGTINQVLRVIFHLSDAPGPLNVYSLSGMVWVLTSFYYPYAFITISRAMEKMDPSLEEASRISGASPLMTVARITLPMMTPSLIAGALLVFVSAASCYGIPSIIGKPGNVSTVTTRIVEYVALGQQGLNDATALSVVLMIVALIILFISDVVLAKRQYITVSGKSVNPAIVNLSSWRIPATIIVSLFAVIMVLVPFVTILTTSFKVDVGKSVWAPANFTAANWTTVFARTETLGCLKNSLIYASITATVGLVVACVMSYLLQRTKVRGRNIPNFLITLGSGTPSVVIALGLIMTMRGNFGVNIYGTAYIMIIAYLIKYMMMGMRTVVSAMSQIHVSMEESSQISGASWLTTMFRITGPLIFSSIAAGWFLIFIPSFYELSMTTLLYSSTTKTIGFQLYEYWTFTSQPMSCAMAFGILLIVILLNFILNRLTHGEFSI